MNAAQPSEGRSYIQYGVLALSLASLLKKSLSPSKEPINALNCAQDEEKNITSTTFSQRVARRIISSALEKRSLKVGDLKKSQERLEYESSLKVLPQENETFVEHTPPSVQSINITSTSHANGIPEYFLEEAPTLEALAYKNSKKAPKLLIPGWRAGTPLALEYYLSTNSSYDRADFSPQDSSAWRGSLDSLDLDEPQTISENFKFRVPEGFGNDFVYLHLYLMTSCEGSEEVGYTNCEYVSKNTIPLSYKLTKTEKAAKKNLLASKKKTREDNIGYELSYMDDVPFWHPEITIYLGKPFGIVEADSVPKAMKSLISVDEGTKRDNLTGLAQRYSPPVLYNNFWQMAHEMIEINTTTRELPINLRLEIPPAWKFRVYSTALHNLRELAMFGGASKANSSVFTLDHYKLVWLGTKTSVLALTVIATVLHSALGVLALKSDTAHWQKRENHIGVSVRGLFANILMQALVMLYLLDNFEGTSSTVFVSQVVGFLIECWKVSTILKIQIVASREEASLNADTEVVMMPLARGKRLAISNKHLLNEEEKKTREYDATAFRILLKVFVPLILGYAGFSLVYGEHKSWYSFFVRVMVGIVYTYGFLIQLPAVYINYKLKSVAHMSKRAFAYKVVNTFIDDLFAFVAKMPWLHKIATFRDDVVFFIYLYQFWAYRVDYARTNEFGEPAAAPGSEKAEKQE
ncbi:KLTH0B04114p [Lachancea thermotolerans CBS 6340]|uniref:KLTH0B04114p n=1 Tax=Lachancea thermotolerans (strain ATCC 56472 / CBS 6340 / NRRL Y-8284) TaxID=559295 RepID=C5DCL8_LACTC|nr:KLTH0B04114p [Lachancea thermotolerans CBS 6340]CAR21529.1 KLTH0B04114p [Lachancea thermotolerans CBS 6340]